YSIFAGTMADLNYQEIEAAAARKAPVLFPLAVMEAHGPHLPVATDMYLSYQFCRALKQALQERNIESIIAPPFYWGINTSTKVFAGSFAVKPETMTAVLSESLECLHDWGFDKIILFNHHGDYLHNKAILEAVKRSSEKNIGAYFLAPEYFAKSAKLSGTQPYVLTYPSETFDLTAKYLDIHAGAVETSAMMKDFPDLVDEQKARTLPSSRTTLDQFKTWVRDLSAVREITPQVYLGEPAVIDTDKSRRAEEQMLKAVLEAIGDIIR
ncbi:MAG: creatininase family protein, partial [Clostridia bacterium]|nr:creatininase family protein [Clostridia bacterium]